MTTMHELTKSIRQQRIDGVKPKEDGNTLMKKLVERADARAREIQDAQDYRELLRQKRLAEGYRW